MKQPTRTVPARFVLLACCLLGAGAVAPTRAADTTIDFNTDPQAAGIYKELGNGAADWRKDGGASGKPGDGYLAITDARGGQQSTLVFKDLDPGKVIRAFTFEADLRIGGGTERPADGFSLNFVRTGDPLLANADAGQDPAYTDFAGTDNEAHLPEEGSATGLGIGFDTWQSAAIKGVPDVVGISVRVDGELITQFPVPLKPGNLYPGGTYDEVPYRNLATTDANYKFSMQTGKRNTDDGFDPNPAQPPLADDPATWALNIKHLVWEKFKAEITEDAKLKIFWKGVELTPAGGLQTKFFPSGGRIVMAGRTGGAWEVHHIDNIRLTTIAAADTAPPTAPQSLTVSGTSTRSVALTWKAATDDSGRVAYEIERDGTIISGAPVTDTAFVDRGLKPNTTYSYKVRTIDPAQNKSAFTSAVTPKTAVETLVPTTGFLKFEAYVGITGTPVDNLLNALKYPDSPDIVSYASAFDSRTVFPDDSHENYGARVSGFFTPTESGQYEFFVRSDDAAQLFLSTDDNAANATVIAEETGCCGAFEESGAPETSAAVSLVAGKKYYIQALYKEGGGGDYVQIAFRKAGSSTPANQLRPIPGNFLSTNLDPNHGAPIIKDSPQSQTVAVGATVTLNASALGTTPLTYQWQQKGKDIAGATNPTLTVSNLQLANAGDYRVVVSNFEGSTTSQSATLTLTGVPTILFLVGNAAPALNPADTAVKARLESQGWQVVVVGAAASQTSDATGKQLIIASSTIPSGNVGNKFTTSPVPLINWEQALQDNLQMTGDTANVDRENIGDQTQLEIINDTHPLAAGLKKGVIAVARSASSFSWGLPADSAIKIAQVAGDNTKFPIYAYDTGAALIDGSKAPARRVNFMLTDNAFLPLNADGLKLFDAAVSWAANITAAPPSGRTYGIGLNFGANEANGNVAATDSAGVASVKQANWNALRGQNGTNTTVVADAAGSSKPTTVRVTWVSNNTWASTGRGEENNKFTGADKTLMTGYLDTGAPTTTTVSITGVPTELTSGGYDVYVYALGGVAGRGGGYRILDANTKAVLKDYVRAQSNANPTEYVKVPVPPPTGTHGSGNYIVFSGLNAANITIEATTASGLGFGSTARAPINAIQLVAPASSAPAVRVAAERTVTGLKVTFTGTLQSADSVTGPWTDVAGATSPRDIPFAGAGKFYRSKQ